MDTRFETFALSILELNRYIQRIKDIEMQKFGLRAGHTMCLYYLGRHGEGLTATELTAMCSEDKAAISRTLSQLLGKKLVTCDIPEGKRAYRTLYFLTDSGREIVKSIDSRIEEIFSGGSEGLTDEQREALYTSMNTILKNLKKLY